MPHWGEIRRDALRSIGISPSLTERELHRHDSRYPSAFRPISGWAPGASMRPHRGQMGRERQVNNGRWLEGIPHRATYWDSPFGNWEYGELAAEEGRRNSGGGYMIF
jgi:hypothetical protein